MLSFLQYIVWAFLLIVLLVPYVVWLLYKLVVKYLATKERSIGNYTAMRRKLSGNVVKDVQLLNTTDTVGKYAQNVSEQISQFENAMNELEKVMCKVFDKDSFTYLKYQDTVSQIKEPFYHNINSAAGIIMKMREITWVGNNSDTDNAQINDDLLLGVPELEDIIGINTMTIVFVQHLVNAINMIENPTEKDTQYIIEQLAEITSHVKYYDYGEQEQSWNM